MAAPRKPKAKKTTKTTAKRSTIKVTAKTTPKLAHNKPKLTVVAPPSRARGTSAERMNLPGPDWNTWGQNMRAYANNNPAALVVGAVTVLMALMLVL